MIVNVIGDCDKRAVLYSMMKILHTLGDVLFLTSDARLLRLSDTGQSCGHYQNVMIGMTSEGVDDFFEESHHYAQDFEYVIIDGIVYAGSDVYVYVDGFTQSEEIKGTLEDIDEYVAIQLYKKKMIDAQTIYRMEEFEAYGNMPPMGKMVTTEVAKILAHHIKQATPEKLLKIGMQYQGIPDQKKPEKKGPAKRKAPVVKNRRKV